MFLSELLDAEVVYNEAQGNGTCSMCEKDGNVRQLDVAIFLEVDDEVVVCQDTGLGEAVHTLVAFAVDKTMDCDGVESVVRDDGAWNFLQCHAHVFGACHGCAQVDILYVKG
jgi:hypothetical protein